MLHDDINASCCFRCTTAIDYQESYVFTEDTDASEDTGDALTIQFDLDGTTNAVYVWFTKGSSSGVASTSVDVYANGTNASSIEKVDDNGVFKISNPKTGADYDFAFTSSGTYYVHAALNNPMDLYGASNGYSTLRECFNNVEYQLGNISGQYSFEITTSSKASEYATLITGENISLEDRGDVVDGATWEDDEKYGADNSEWEIASGTIAANNVAEYEYTVKFVDKDGKAVKGETVTLDTNSSNIELNKEKATTDTLGQIKFKISGVRDGEYKVYITCGSYETTIVVKVGATGAYNIAVAKSPDAPVDVTTQFDSSHNKVQFTFTDANGNAVTTDIAKDSGATKAFYDGDEPTNAYVSIVSQPSASDLENKDLWLIGADDDNYKANLYINDNNDLAEGSYTIKVVLDNGNYVTVTFEVQEFGTPVELNLEYEAEAVEIGSYVEIDTLEWVDANGVTKDCTSKVDLAATGYAVENFYTSATLCQASTKHYDEDNNVVKHSVGTVEVKDDDKYVGSTITVIAVDDRYNLTANATITVADEATELAFDTKTLAVDANNKVGVSVVDGSGNTVALNRGELC